VRSVPQIRRPITTVGVNVPRLIADITEDVGYLRCDGEYERMIGIHDPRHAMRLTTIARIGALAAVVLVGPARFVQCLVFRRERCLLPEAARLAWVPFAILVATHARPSAGPIRIERISHSFGINKRNAYYRGERHRSDQVLMHAKCLQ